MPGKEHCFITEHAIKLLDEWEQNIIAPEFDNLVNEYCKYPDTYFDVNGGGHEKALPYYFETDGIQFHYIPDTPVADKYRYWNVLDGKLTPGCKSENLNWKHAKNGFTYYLTNAVGCLKKDKVKEALSFTGCLLHMLQDSTFSLHSLEGVYGTDLFVLDRLFEYGDDFTKMPSNVMVGDIPAEAVVSPSHTPASLGNSISEAVFILYTHYAATSLRARKLTFQIIQKRVEGKIATDQFREMFQGSTKLIADVLNTIFHLAADKHVKLPKLYLSDIEPIERPWGIPGPYRFTTMLKDNAIVADGKSGPLKLTVDGVEREFEKGMSFGCHVTTSFIYDIPKDVFGEFKCFVGLQTEYAKTGNAKVEFLNNGKIVLAKKIDAATPSHSVTIKKPEGLFEIRCSSPDSARMRTVITLGNPELGTLKGL